MQWELDWVSSNVHRYTSFEHAEAVKRNIEKRYKILSLELTIKRLEEQVENETR